MKRHREGDREFTTLEALARDLVRGASAEIQGADASVRARRRDEATDDPESIRVLRLSFRRIQYQLEAIASVEDDFRPTQLIQRLREVTKPLGRLRDAEVLESLLVKALDHYSATPENGRLRELAGEVRRSQQLAVDSLIDSGAYRHVVRDLGEYQTLLTSYEAPRSQSRPLAKRIIRSSWAELRRAVERAEHHVNDERLHHVRIAAKRTLYATQAFSPMVGEPAPELAVRLDSFQKYLGKQHDHVVLSEWVAKIAKTDTSLRALTTALFVQEREEADHLAQRWRRHWSFVRQLDLDPLIA